MILGAWFRLRARGLVDGLFQMRFLFRAVMRVANCALVSGGCTLVVQWSFPVVFEVICDDLSSFLLSVGLLSSWGGYPL